MNARFLLGPAGSGKTYRCLKEIRTCLKQDPLGPPLILLAPRQATYQLELQLLSDPDLSGYTRLQIVSFERFAVWLLQRLGLPVRDPLSEEGRIMVLRALLHEHHPRLKTFGASGRATGFARLLSEQLRELQQHRVSATALLEAAGRADNSALSGKLHDLALMLDKYQDWLRDHQSPDTGTLLDDTIANLSHARSDASNRLHIEALWLDGVAELTPQELELLAGLTTVCQRMTLAFCLDSVPKEDAPWLSTWSVISQTFRRCVARLDAEEACRIDVEVIERGRHPSRFHDRPPAISASGQAVGEPLREEQIDLFTPLEGGRNTAAFKPVHPLEALECGWTTGAAGTPNDPGESIRLVRCANPEQEATMAAREILRFVQSGNRFKDCAVLLRQMDTHYAELRRVFNRFDIPFFMDRRESVTHHPFVELTRSALHTVQFNWRIHDWFGALKTGLTPLPCAAVDRLENAALKYGWEGTRWLHPITLADDPELARECESMRRTVLVPFMKLREDVDGEPTGRRLAAALRSFWEAMEVEARLEEWVENESDVAGGAVHRTVWDEMERWLGNLEQAFSEHALPLREWMPILETGLSVLTVGVIPPAMDQVLVGAVDRSRNPDLKLAIVLGLNEGVFPRPVPTTGLLTDADRDALEPALPPLRTDRRIRLGHERYLGYIAFTRSRERLILGWSEQDAGGRLLNASSLIDHVRRMFPNAMVDDFSGSGSMDDCVHPAEVLAPLLQGVAREPLGPLLKELPTVQEWLDRFDRFSEGRNQTHLSRDSVAALFGDRLRTSASRLEEFAACPFKHFVRAGLRAEERKHFEVDARKTGTFMHEVLRQFHNELQSEGLKWRSLSPQVGRERIARIAGEQLHRVADGVLASQARHRFAAVAMTELLQEFVATTIGWMSSYRFDPVAVELSIGGEEGLPAWELPLDDTHTLVFRGSVDRVDAAPCPDRSNRICLNVLDYKSGQKKFETARMQAGLQLQLPAYLAALSAIAGGGDWLPGRRVLPTGMFYVRLKDANVRVSTREESPAGSRNKAFEHTGRFSFDWLALFDSDPAGNRSGQFSYRLTKGGEPVANCQELLRQEALEAVLADAGEMLRVMGREIVGGNIAVNPYRHGSDLPCDRCEYKSICRIDPWTHPYRPLSPLLADATARD